MRGKGGAQPLSAKPKAAREARGARPPGGRAAPQSPRFLRIGGDTGMIYPRFAGTGQDWKPAF